MRTVVEESQGSSAAGGIVDHLCHHRTILLEEELVADTDLSSRLYQHIPQTQLLVELTQQEHLDLGIGLFLGAVETGGEHLGVVKDKRVVLVEIVEDIAEVEIDRVAFLILEILAILIFLGHFDRAALAVDDHQTAFITVEGRLKGNLLFW